MCILWINILSPCTPQRYRQNKKLSQQISRQAQWSFHAHNCKHSQHTHDTIALTTHTRHNCTLSQHTHDTIARTHDNNCTHWQHTTQLHALTTQLHALTTHTTIIARTDHTRHNCTPSRHTITRTHDKIARHDTVGDCFPTSLSIPKTLHVKFEGAALR